MRAARVHAWHAAPVIDEVPEPVRGPGETLVRIDAAGVTHLDTTVQTGEFVLRPPLPYTVGCEGAGTVLESDTLPIGSQVIFRDGALGLDRDGTWTERVVVPDEALYALPVVIDPAIASTFFSPTATAAVALFEIGGLRPGQTVGITGATGMVGSMAIQIARDAGATVIAVVSVSSKTAHVPPGVRTVALDDPEATAALRAQQPIDLLLDTVGGVGLADRIGWVTAGGKAVVVGYTAGEQVTIDLPTWFFGGVALLPMNLMAHEAAARRYAADLLPKFADGTYTLETHDYPLERAAAALAKLQAGEITGRAVLRPVQEGSL